MTKPRARVYDDFLPAPLLKLVLARREHPDGRRHPLSSTIRAGRQVTVYPWDKMEVGDFFEVPIGDKSERAMRVALNQAAARLDAEIAVRLIKDSKNQHCFRVTLVLFGVRGYLATAAKAGVHVSPRSDGRWRERKNRWAKGQKAKPRPVRAYTPEGQEVVMIHQPTGEFAPEVKLTREEILRRAMEQSQ